jgi:hypothetical protein
MEVCSKDGRLRCCLDFPIDTCGLYYTIKPVTKTFRQRILPYTIDSARPKTVNFADYGVGLKF